MNDIFHVGWRGVTVCLAGGHHLSCSSIEPLNNDISFCFFTLSRFSLTSNNVGILHANCGSSSRAVEDQEDQTPQSHFNSRKNSVLSGCKSPTPHDLGELQENFDSMQFSLHLRTTELIFRLKNDSEVCHDRMLARDNLWLLHGMQSVWREFVRWKSCLTNRTMTYLSHCNGERQRERARERCWHRALSYLSSQLCGGGSLLVQEEQQDPIGP